jgi:hypothetical protein
LSLSYQTEQVPIVQYSTKTEALQTNIYSTIYVSNYKIYETVVRRYITKIISRYLTPDGIEVARVEIPTNYLETEYVSGRITQYTGVKPVLVSASPQISGSLLSVAV